MQFPGLLCDEPGRWLLQFANIFFKDRIFSWELPLSSYHHFIFSSIYIRFSSTVTIFSSRKQCISTPDMNCLQIYFKRSYHVLVVDIFRWGFFDSSYVSPSNFKRSNYALVVNIFSLIFSKPRMHCLQIYFKLFILRLRRRQIFSFKVSQFSSHFTISRRRTLVVMIIVAYIVIMRKRFHYPPQSLDTYLKPGFQSRPSLLNKSII